MSENIDAVNSSSSTDKVEPTDESSEDSKTNSSSWLPETKWTNSWVNSAKERTKSTFETIKKDIHEFTDTLHTETNSLASAAVKKAQELGQIITPFQEAPNKATEQAAENPKEVEKTQGAADIPIAQQENLSAVNQPRGGTGHFFGLNWVKQVASEVVETVHKFATEDTTKDEAECTEEIRLGPGGRKTILDQCTLLQMQNDRRTFLQNPQRGADLYDEWLTGFRISEYNGEINLLLGNNPRLREIYAELVPSQVDNFMFWNRYFFKVHLKESEKQELQAVKNLEMDKKTDATLCGGHSPAPSNGRDDWSMCSDRIAEVEELDTDVKAERREDTSTPRPQKPDEDVEDWEECEGGETSETIQVQPKEE